MFYASVAKGARSAVPNFTDAIFLIETLGLPVPYDLVLDADSILTYELGVKAVLAEGTWTIEAAVYYSDWEDLSTTVPVVGLGGPGTAGQHGGRGTSRESIFPRPMSRAT